MSHRPPAGHDSEAPPAVQDVEWSDTTGTVRFAHGTCTLRATADALTVRIDADDEDTLRRLQAGLARRLEAIGRRDDLTIHWRESNSLSGRPTENAPPAPVRSREPPGLGRALVVAGIVVLALAIHVGLLGSTLAASPWTSWGALVVLAIILVKVVVLGVHVVLGRAAFRHRGTILRRLRGYARASGDSDQHQRPS